MVQLDNDRDRSWLARQQSTPTSDAHPAVAAVVEVVSSSFEDDRNTRSMDTQITHPIDHQSALPVDAQMMHPPTYAPSESIHATIHAIDLALPHSIQVPLDSDNNSLGDIQVGSSGSSSSSGSRSDDDSQECAQEQYHDAQVRQEEGEVVAAAEEEGEDRESSLEGEAILAIDGEVDDEMGEEEEEVGRGAVGGAE